MNNDVELEGRPRPLSAGLWTLFSWLRRDDRSDSSESLSSAGSDRTVASFAFLKPAHYQPAATPLVLPPPGPPTDSYRKRIHDRNLRRQYDRDITLHRKYGLFKSGEVSSGYDAFSLPPARRINGEVGGRRDRDRRATSECFQRRLAHVPGKRRAPLPPSLTTATATTSLTRRSTRKRRAPQPPIKIIDTNKENLKQVQTIPVIVQMNPDTQDKQKNINNDMIMGCKSEKYIKKDGSSKDVKVRSDKGFLKHIFDSKKRNSSIDISSVKLLPSISELDKQAAEIIETCKLNASEPNNNIQNIVKNIETQGSTQPESWMCVNCLRKFNSSIPTCLYCLPNKNNNKLEGDSKDKCLTSKASSSYTQTEKNIPNGAFINKNTVDEKQKLKEMLKEMKDSLPKRPKHDNVTNKSQNKTITIEPGPSFSTETPTLRVGTTIQEEEKRPKEVTKSKNVLTNVPYAEKNKPTPLPQSEQIMPNKSECKKKVTSSQLNQNDVIYKKQANEVNNQETKQRITSSVEVSHRNEDKIHLNTPLKISSLLNPVYIPKRSTNYSQTETKNETPTVEPPKQATNSPSEAKTKTEKNIVEAIILDNTRRFLQTTSASTDAVAGPSTSQISGVPISANRVDNKPRIELQKYTTEAYVESKSSNNPAEIKKDNAPIINPEIKKAIAPSSSASEQKDARDQHSRRRNLIHQLEQSIAKGDERAAAEAASKLAQLRLSCSVLSFSSQILSQPSTSTTNTEVKEDMIKNNPVQILPAEKDSKVQCVQVRPERSPKKIEANNVRSSAKIVSSNLAKPPAPSGSNKEPLKDLKDKTVPILMTTTTSNNNMITIPVLVEDREATRGPIHLRIRRQALMRDLRREAETSLGLATNLQRWIVGRVLCVNDDTPVASLAGPDFKAPFYLCVVDSGNKTNITLQSKTGEKTNNNGTVSENKVGNVYTELVELEQRALVPNTDNFECGVCMEDYAPGAGVVLRECVHIFCKDCLSDVVRHCEEPDIPCPAMGCRGNLQEREIRALVTTQDYERWLARGLAAAESGTRNAFHCRTRDCKGWALCEPGVQRFPCPVCKHTNCVPCQAIHDNETCQQYQDKQKQAAAGPVANSTVTDDGTRTLLNALIAKGEALECPECSAIITKKWGCDWVKCSACKTEICWVTRGRRWGPGGKGDTSGGCRCGVDGKRCHPSCGYCH